MVVLREVGSRDEAVAEGLRYRRPLKQCVKLCASVPVCVPLCFAA